MIRKDGYYMSEGKAWVDWHAGHKFEGVSFYVLIFFDEHKVLRLSLNDADFDIKKLINEYPTNDTYKTFDEVIEIQINPLGRFKKTRQFTILSPDILLDENMGEYRFITFINDDSDQTIK